MFSPHKHAWLAALSLVLSVSVWDAEIERELASTPAIEPAAPHDERTAPVATKNDAPVSPPSAVHPARHWLHWGRDPADEREVGKEPVAQPTATIPPVVLDGEDAEPCLPARRPKPQLVRRDFSWRWCSPP